MSFAERWADPGWRATALLFLGMLLLLALLRLREAARLHRRFPRERVVRSSYLVTCYGLESQPAGGALRSLGAAVLLKDGLHFQARVTPFQLTIPASAILHIGLTNTHRGRTLRQYVVAIRFRNPEGQGETAAFRFAQPGRWLTALRETLLPGRA
jgi:hypothetical protein